MPAFSAERVTLQVAANHSRKSAFRFASNNFGRLIRATCVNRLLLGWMVKGSCVEVGLVISCKNQIGSYMSIQFTRLNNAANQPSASGSASSTSTVLDLPRRRAKT